MRERLQAVDRALLKPFVLPTAVGTAITVAAGFLGGGWRTGAFLGGSIGGAYAALEYLKARGAELRDKHGGT